MTARDKLPALDIPLSWEGAPIRALVTIAAIVIVVAMSFHVGARDLASAGVGALVAYLGKLNGRA